MIEYRIGMQNIFKKKKKSLVLITFCWDFNVQSLEIILTEHTFHHLEKKHSMLIDLK